MIEQSYKSQLQSVLCLASLLAMCLESHCSAYLSGRSLVRSLSAGRSIVFGLFVNECPPSPFSSTLVSRGKQPARLKSVSPLSDAEPTSRTRGAKKGDIMVRTV